MAPNNKIIIELDDESGDETEQMNSVKFFRQELASQMMQKHGGQIALQMQKTLPLLLIQDILHCYDVLLKGELEALSRRFQINFKFMVRDRLSMANQLSYWILTDESKPSEQYPYRKSFVVFISKEMWRRMQIEHPHVKLDMRNKMPSAYIWNSKQLNNDSLGLFMLLLEFYISVFIAICLYGHSAYTDEKTFHLKMREVYSARFGETEMASVWAPWQKQKKLLYNTQTGQIGLFVTTERNGSAVWVNGEHRIEVWSTFVPIRLDFYQGKIPKLKN